MPLAVQPRPPRRVFADRRLSHPLPEPPSWGPDLTLVSKAAGALSALALSWRSIQVRWALESLAQALESLAQASESRAQALESLAQALESLALLSLAPVWSWASQEQLTLLVPTYGRRSPGSGSASAPPFATAAPTVRPGPRCFRALQPENRRRQPPGSCRVGAAARRVRGAPGDYPERVGSPHGAASQRRSPRRWLAGPCPALTGRPDSRDRLGLPSRAPHVHRRCRAARVLSGRSRQRLPQRPGRARSCRVTSR